MDKEYSLWLHFKQGDDFANHLERTNGDVSEAFASWSAQFKGMADHCMRISSITKGHTTLEAWGDTHYVGFRPTDEASRKLLDVMAIEELITVDTFPGDDEVGGEG